MRACASRPHAFQKSRVIVTNNTKSHAENAETYRAKAAELAETVRTVRSLKQGSEARQSQKAYTALADNEIWLAANADKLA
jgi:hypothetical protein